MVGTGRAAELGVLFRQGSALQTLTEARVVVFDKTGTITRGQPELTDLVLAPAIAEDAALRLIAALEAKSEHPIAKAILSAAEKKSIKLPPASDVQARAGFGIIGLVEGQKIALGTQALMESEGVDTDALSQHVQEWASQGKTALYAASNGVLIAVLAVGDSVKDDAADAIARLKAKGLSVAMLSGDSEVAARAIASTVGIDEVIGGVLPAGKVEALQQLRARHGAVAFVGDGINDAPALAEAEIGIAIGTGTDVAIEAADVVLMSGQLAGVPRAIELSQRTMRTIHQNLFWAFAYNVLLIPVAAGLLYPALGVLLSPGLAAGAMALSSVFVLTNALRLRYALGAERPV
jgi:Cu+-exporting ATPase